MSRRAMMLLWFMLIVLNAPVAVTAEVPTVAPAVSSNDSTDAPDAAPVTTTTTAPVTKAPSAATSAAPSETTNRYFVGAEEGDESNNAYRVWYDSRGAANYEHSVFLNVNKDSDDQNDGLALHWTILPKEDGPTMIQVAVAARATAWVGFGLAEAGGMPGSDIFVCNSTHVMDMYSVAYDTPLLDENQQDWILVDEPIVQQNDNDDDGFLICEVSRVLDTGDRQEDRALYHDDIKGTDQPHRVIAAWGDGAWGYHGPHNRVSGAVRFFNHQGHGGLEADLFQAAMEEEAVHSLDIFNTDYVIPFQKTHYVKICFTLSQDFPFLDPEQAFHAIGIEPVSGSPRHVHHMVLSASPTDYGAIPRRGPECNRMFNSNDPPDALYGWAVGEGSVALPEQAGMPVAGGRGYRSFRLSIHYDNRFLDANIVDPASGFRLYLSPNLRPYDMGMMILGMGSLKGTTVGGPDGGLYRYHDFTCPSSCTSSFLDDGDEMVIVGELLHMHETGARMYNRLLNATGHVVHEGVIDYWDVDQSGLFPTSTSGYTIRAGDSMESRCYFDASKTTGDSSEIVWGNGSQDEMCIAFLWYYPKRDSIPDCGYSDSGNSPCRATYRTETSEDDELLGRVFGAGTEAVSSSKRPSSSADSGAAGIGEIPGSKSAIGFVLAMWYCLLLI